MESNHSLAMRGKTELEKSRFLEIGPGTKAAGPAFAGRILAGRAQAEVGDTFLPCRSLALVATVSLLMPRKYDNYENSNSLGLEQLGLPGQPDASTIVLIVGEGHFTEFQIKSARPISGLEVGNAA